MWNFCVCLHALLLSRSFQYRGSRIHESLGQDKVSSTTETRCEALPRQFHKSVGSVCRQRRKKTESSIGSVMVDLGIWHTTRGEGKIGPRERARNLQSTKAYQYRALRDEAKLQNSFESQNRVNTTGVANAALFISVSQDEVAMV